MKSPWQSRVVAIWHDTNLHWVVDYGCYGRRPPRVEMMEGVTSLIAAVEAGQGIAYGGK